VCAVRRWVKGTGRGDGGLEEGRRSFDYGMFLIFDFGEGTKERRNEGMNQAGKERRRRKGRNEEGDRELMNACAPAWSPHITIRLPPRTRHSLEMTFSRWKGSAAMPSRASGVINIRRLCVQVGDGTDTRPHIPLFAVPRACVQLSKKQGKERGRTKDACVPGASHGFPARSR
jgi:hypothetical protein